MEEEEVHSLHVFCTIDSMKGRQQSLPAGEVKAGGRQAKHGRRCSLTGR
jgi:hypothetical protein